VIDAVKRMEEVLGGREAPRTREEKEETVGPFTFVFVVAFLVYGGYLTCMYEEGEGMREEGGEEGGGRMEEVLGGREARG
jgi:hypothetical protein